MLTHLNNYIFATCFMILKRISSTLLCLVIISGFCYSQSEYDWKLVKTQGDIKAYVRKLPNTKIRSVKVETTAQTSLSELVSIIKDAPRHPEWVYLNSKSQILDTISQQNWIFYGMSDLPWPISDRDFVTKAVITQDTADLSVEIISVGIPDYIPEVEDCIRIELVHLKWLLIPHNDGTVKITLELTVDLGGKIPSWFINLAVAKGPMQTMIGLVNTINGDCYKNSKVGYLTEL